MVISDLFRGIALNAIDKKGRVSVPADFRATIQTRHRRAIAEDGFDPAANDAENRHAAAGRIVIVAKAKDRPCLIAYENTYSRVLRDRIELRHADKAGIEREQAIQKDFREFARSEDLVWDVNGRIMLNPRLCAKVGIEPEGDAGVCFVGLGETFEIWHPQSLADAMAADGDDDAADDVRALIAEKAK